MMWTGCFFFRIVIEYHSYMLVERVYEHPKGVNIYART